MTYSDDLRATIFQWKDAQQGRSLRGLAKSLRLSREIVRRAADGDVTIPLGIAQRIASFCDGQK